MTDFAEAIQKLKELNSSLRSSTTPMLTTTTTTKPLSVSMTEVAAAGFEEDMNEKMLSDTITCRGSKSQWRIVTDGCLQWMVKQRCIQPLLFFIFFTILLMVLRPSFLYAPIKTRTTPNEVVPVRMSFWRLVGSSFLMTGCVHGLIFFNDQLCYRWFPVTHT